MSDDYAKLLTAALELGEEERAALAEALVSSLPGETPLAEGWDAELAERLRQIDSGEVEMIPWEVVDQELREIVGDPEE